MKNFIRLALIAAALVPLAACVHEYPEEGKEIDPTEIGLTLELSTDPSITSASVFSKSGETAPYVYFVIELYKDDYTGEPAVRHEEGAIRNSDGSASLTVTVPVHAGKYRLAAFAACVEDETGSGCIYNLDDLGNISFASGEYAGSTALKECYDLRMDIDLSNSEWHSEETVSGVLSAPVGRLEIISEDAADFVTKLQTSVGQAANDETFWEDYELRWDYALYSPVGYNVFTGMPEDSETGIGFRSDIFPLNENEVLMGYDYIFVNGEKAGVNITLGLYERATGNLLNTYSGLTADIFRGETTVIRGDFLTTNQGSGIGIDPGFDGDIDITLPD